MVSSNLALLVLHNQVASLIGIVSSQGIDQLYAVSILFSVLHVSLLPVVLTALCPPTLGSSYSSTRDAHGTGGTGDHAHGGFQMLAAFRSGHLDARRSSCTCSLVNLPTLSRLGRPEAVSQVQCLLNQNGNRRSLGDEGEGAVGVHGDDNGDDQAGLLGGALIELLAEARDVHAVLTQRRADRRRGSRLARREPAA